MPAAEVDVDKALVRRLLEAQFPDLADRPIVGVTSGWDNAIFRLGDDLAARLPRRALAAPLVEHEQRWLPGLAPRLPLPVPTPVRAGRPSNTYPWAWSICPWLPGVVAIQQPPDDPMAAAAALGEFVAALHDEAPGDAPANPYRGIPLADRHEGMIERLDQMGDVIDARAVRARWDQALALSPWSRPPVWIHGDLHPANILVDGGHVAAVIDFGDLTAGDPATDLALAWMMFPPDARLAFRGAAGAPDDDTWGRARGWALALGLAFLANSADNPPFARLGARTLEAVLTDRG